MAFFFFGTLMDRDVLEQVLDRKVSDRDVAAARLHGYRRVRAAHEPYPVLVPDPAADPVPGLLLLRASVRDEVRISHFEEDEYVEHWVTVELDAGGVVRARAFFAAADLGATDQPWDPAAWAREHKARYLDLCREWMRDCHV